MGFKVVVTDKVPPGSVLMVDDDGTVLGQALVMGPEAKIDPGVKATLQKHVRTGEIYMALNAGPECPIMYTDKFKDVPQVRTWFKELVGALGLEGFVDETKG